MIQSDRQVVRQRQKESITYKDRQINICLEEQIERKV